MGYFYCASIWFVKKKYVLLLTKKFEENARGEFGYGIYYQNLSIEAFDTVKSHSLLICINTLSLEKSKRNDITNGSLLLVTIGEIHTTSTVHDQQPFQEIPVKDDRFLVKITCYVLITLKN